MDVSANVHRMLKQSSNIIQGISLFSQVFLVNSSFTLQQGNVRYWQGAGKVSRPTYVNNGAGIKGRSSLVWFFFSSSSLYFFISFFLLSSLSNSFFNKSCLRRSESL